MQGVRALFRPRIYHFEALLGVPLSLPSTPPRGSDSSISLDRAYEPLELSFQRATDLSFPLLPNNNPLEPLPPPPPPPWLMPS